MKHIKKQVTSILFFLLFLFIGTRVHAQGMSTPPEKKVVEAPTVDDIAKLLSAVEADPTDLTAHKAYIKAAGIANPGIEKQYESWMQKFPKLAAVPFAIGDAFANAS